MMKKCQFHNNKRDLKPRITLFSNESWRLTVWRLTWLMINIKHYTFKGRDIAAAVSLNTETGSCRLGEIQIWENTIKKIIKVHVLCLCVHELLFYP